jgi:hypothetical protein
MSEEQEKLYYCEFAEFLYKRAFDSFNRDIIRIVESIRKRLEEENG